MKNVTKILIAVTLCAAVFASTQRTNALGVNPAFWPGDEANIAAFPAQINNHGYLQLSGVGNDNNTGSASLVFNNNGTAWSFGFANNADTWVNIGWGKNGMGVLFTLTSSDAGLGDTEGAEGDQVSSSGFDFSYGNTFDWGELGFHYSSGSTDTVGSAFEAAVAATYDECDCTAIDAANGDTACADADTSTAELCTAAGGDIVLNNDAEAAEARVDVSTDWDRNGMSVDFRKECGFWVFTDMVATLDMPDEGAMSMGADWFTHMDASGADVMFAMGFDWSDSEDDGTGGGMGHSAAIGVEANMTDWAAFRAGVNWNYQLSGDDDKVGSHTYGWATGLGFNWGGFTADYTVSDSIFKNPIGYMTGNITSWSYTEAGGDGAGGGGSKGLTDHAVTLTYSF